MENKKTIAPLREKITIDIDLTSIKHGFISFLQNSPTVKPLTASFNIKWNCNRQVTKLTNFINMYYLKKNNEHISNAYLYLISDRTNIYGKINI